MNWKDHPIVVAAIATGSSIAFCVTFIVPIYEKNNLNKISELEKADTALNEKLVKATEELLQEKNKNEDTRKKLSNEIKEKSTKILELQEEDRFNSETPFPKGFRSVQLLDNVNNIEAAYKDNKISKTKLWISVDIDDNLFSSVTYYPITFGDSKRISHVLFHFKQLDSINIDENFNIVRKTDDDLKKYGDSLYDATLKILKEKYGESKYDPEEQEHRFYINKFWQITLTARGMVISTIYKPKSILNQNIDNKKINTKP
ncbi:hypothetical protein [Pseudomonas amygdali]|uniref:hypothetical protein n=1 Tax=Pseudomonas amygdali TaxID=47877 RepID=UPI000E3CF2F5|nr:hypothetical protein [Pseudomonas amygdali]